MLFVCFNPTLQACTVKNIKAYTALSSIYLSPMMSVGQCIIWTAAEAEPSAYEHFLKKLQCYCFISLADLFILCKDPRTFRQF